MANSINQVTLSGNLTRDPEVRTTKAGQPVMTFGLAVNEQVKNSQTGEWENRANFIDCTMFGNRAEVVAKYLKKGSHVMIAGKLRYSTWERDGQKRSKIEVIVNDIDFTANAANSSAETTPEIPLHDEDVSF